jgi:hypothetical protein
MNSSIAVVILSTGVGFGLSSVIEVACHGKGFTLSRRIRVSAAYSAAVVRQGAGGRTQARTSPLRGLTWSCDLSGSHQLLADRKVMCPDAPDPGRWIP